MTAREKLGRLIPGIQNFLAPFITKIRNAPFKIKILGIVSFTAVYMLIGSITLIDRLLRQSLASRVSPLYLSSLISQTELSIFFLTLLFILPGLVIAYLATHVMTRPLTELLALTRAAGEGNYNARVQVKFDDEIGKLVHAANEMIESLQANKIRNEAQAQQMWAWNRELVILSQLSSTLNRGLELQKILDDTIEQIMVLFKCDTGGIFFLNCNEDELQLIVERGHTPEMIKRLSRLKRGEGVSWQAVLRQEPVLHAVEDETIRPIMLDFTLATGYKKFLNIPLSTKNSRIGALTITFRREYTVSEREMAMLQTIGNQIAIAIERARLWEYLKTQDQRRRELVQKAVSAQEEERTRVARELHDGVGQGLTSLLIQLKIMEQNCPTQQTDLTRLRQMASAMIEEVQRVSYELRPSLLDELGLIEALQDHAHTLQERCNLHIQFNLVPGAANVPLSKEAELCLFRIAQEALSNVMRHARADWVEIEFRPLKDALEMSISDNGQGFNPQALMQNGNRCLGIFGMEERAALVYGVFSLESEVSRGTRVKVSVPAQMEW